MKPSENSGALHNKKASWLAIAAVSAPGEFRVFAWWWPVLFVLALVAIHSLAHLGIIHQTELAVKPRSFENLWGILTFPLVHGGWKHLFNNASALLVMGWALFYFYPDLAKKSVFWIWLMSGLWLYLGGRPTWHLGASGLVYGLAAFLFFSGWFRREKRVAALSLLIVFLYGSLWWGILPVDEKVSFEGHLFGGLAGFVLALYLRKRGVQRPVYSWELEEEEVEQSPALSTTNPSEEPTIAHPETGRRADHSSQSISIMPQFGSSSTTFRNGLNDPLQKSEKD